MAKMHRKWSEEQKLQIIQEVEHNGLTETLRKYNLAQSLFSRWRRAYNGEGFNIGEGYSGFARPAARETPGRTVAI
jgi:transposase-like protein